MLRSYRCFATVCVCVPPLERHFLRALPLCDAVLPVSGRRFVAKRGIAVAPLSSGLGRGSVQVYIKIVAS